MRLLLISIGLLITHVLVAQEKPAFTHADTLRGSITPERSWWDVSFYDLHVRVNSVDSSLQGHTVIRYKILKAASVMQIDLMEPLTIDSVIQDGQPLNYRRDGNAYFVTLQKPQALNATESVTAYYHGNPIVAKRAPWDGGVVWGKDQQGRDWIATACQGVGASIWWPNKDHQSDEPDSMGIHVTVPEGLTDVSNGRLRGRTKNADRTETFYWFVSNPINNYDVALNIAHYAHFDDTFDGEKGKLNMDFWVLDYNMEKAKKQFAVVKPMLTCFEGWFGPYPFYEDSYKLVETPHLGMEHQSAVAYGNEYQMGYRGQDLSGTGWGLKWDFIIIHESGHEWFGNNITTDDIADMWVHEGFTNYSENLFVECQYGKEAGAAYVIGTRQQIENDRPIIGTYNVNAEGSGDMYSKGGNMLHTIRQIVNDDEKWRAILRGLNETFRHQTVTGQDVIAYVTKQSGKKLDNVFAQYLETTKIPVLEYALTGKKLRYRWTNVVDGFEMPVKVRLGTGAYEFIYPTTEWKTTKTKLANPADFAVDKNFYVEVKKME